MCAHGRRRRARRLARPVPGVLELGQDLVPARRAAQGLVSERVFLSGERPWPPRPTVHADRPATGFGGEGKPAEGPDPRQQRLPAPFRLAQTPQFGHWGAYDHYESVGSKDRFRQAVQECQQAGVPVGLYLDGYVVANNSDKPAKSDIEKWAIQGPGIKASNKAYQARAMCPYVKEWRDYLTAAFRRVADEVKPDGMYMDEFGGCLTSHTCYSTGHGHPAPMGMCPGEWLLSRQIRQALPAKIATYCEYVPADVAHQYLDGAFGHVAFYNSRDGYAWLAPHFVDLQRFAFPDFKVFETIYCTPMRNGNWTLLKYPFFNGHGYYLAPFDPVNCDQHYCEFLTRVFRVQHAHGDAFTSSSVEPLVPTEQSGVYANRFSTPKKNVWTLFNANYRTVRGPLLRVSPVVGATYFDAWNERPLRVNTEGSAARLEIDLGPRAVGCVMQQLP